ncbi:phosphoribosylanthranilate isomerase [Lunatibacter salilacus]|uniref:phosphoribosylanthranilate isomerase n=1 Tax=Lunatibacter salilacus TaxID=2483804 RepID=UPI00131B6645|nr:phosphoribosylanthranilate isomerase [Lunatibacter salilacus]
MIVKVCGMREEENVKKLISDAAPDLMGLIFYPPSARYVERDDVHPEFYKEFSQKKVGVFVNESNEEIGKKIQTYGLSYVQLHGDESPEFIALLKQHTSAIIIKVFRIGPTWNWKQVQPYVGVADWFLFDTQTPDYGGSGKTFDWGVLEKYPYDMPFLLSGGLDETHIDAINSLVKRVPYCVGVDINSRFEISPGLKDIARVKTFINKVRLD